jgi:stage II sporulation protein D
MKKLLLWFIVAAFLSSCAASGRRFGGGGNAGPDIRVLLEEGGSNMTISSTGGLMVKAANGQTLSQVGGETPISIRSAYPALNYDVNFGEKVGTAEEALAIVPLAQSVLTHKGVPYSGTMKVVFGSERKPVLLNVLPVESYLKGVLPHEIGNPGPEGYDALKSQAVAARTYALGKMEERRRQHFDVYASVMDQVYRGQEGTQRTLSGAIRATRGEVLGYKGQTVRAYYSSCCGGHTSNIAHMWPRREYAEYLTGIPDRDGRSNRAFCINNRYFRWRYSFSGRELGDILRVTLPRIIDVGSDDVGVLKDIRIGERSRSGRVMSIDIETTKDQFTITGDEIRWVLVTDLSQNRILPSTMFRIDKMKDGDRVEFVSFAGGGNGHGVGMCQNGAIGMARKGYTYKMILSHYYPGCTVAKAY